MLTNIPLKKYRLTPSRIFFFKIIIHGVSLSFFAFLILQTINGSFSADPIKDIEHFTGKAALNTLLLTLLLSPLAKLCKQGGLIKVRRLFGLYCFFWATLHLSVYLVFDLNFNWALLGNEIIDRPYLTLGAISWVILFLLTITSPLVVQRRLGKYWQPLHNWIYLVLILTPIHYYLAVKSEITEPVIYIIIAIALLFWRRQKIMKWLVIINAKFSF